MRWPPRALALLSGAAFCALAGVGATYVVSVAPRSSTLTESVPPVPPATDSTTLVPGPGPGEAATQTPSVPPSSATAGFAVTLTARPSVRPTPTPTPSPRLQVPAPVPTTAAPTPTPQAPPELDFRLTSFNVLGAGLAAAGGSRAGSTVALLARHGSDVVGFQELRVPQLAVLKRLAGMDFYPGSSLGRLGAENSIGWKRDEWVAVDERTVTIPYLGGGLRQMPYVRLRSVRTGIEAWFANFHNPADTARFDHQQRLRVRATLVEARLARQLLDATGLPVFITGDMSERAPYFCRLTAAAPMVAARGGSNTGACLAGRPGTAEWIFGSRGVDFTSYDEDRSDPVDLTTDHPVVTASVHLVGGPAAGTGTGGLGATTD